MLRSYPVVTFFLAIPLFLMVYAKHPDGLSTFAPWRVYSNYSIDLIMYLTCYSTCGWFVFQSLKRGLPFFIGLFVMLCLGTLITTTTAGLFFFTSNDAETLLRYASTAMVLGLSATVLIVEMTKTEILRAFRRIYPDATVYGWKKPQRKPEDFADVIMLKAENQYTLVVRENSRELVRKPFGKVVEDMPSSAGLRVHRSYWLRTDQIRDIIYQDGNSKVVDASGGIIPLSRGKVENVREALAAN